MPYLSTTGKEGMAKLSLSVDKLKNRSDNKGRHQV